MRGVGIWVVCSLLVEWSGPLFAQPAVPFHSLNLSPAVAIFGQPIWEVASRQRVFVASTEVANHYQFSRSGTDALALDGETGRVSFFYSQPIAEQWSVSAAVAFVHQSGGFLDDIIDSWHSLFRMPDGGRNARPEDALLFQMRHGGQAFYELDDERRGLGDLQVALARRFGADQRFVGRIAVKLPTGKESLLAGSGARDWSVTVLRPRDTMVRGHSAGYYWGVGWLGLGTPTRIAYPVEPGAVVGILGAGIKVLPRFGIKAQLDVHTAMYDTPLEELGQTAVQATIGGWWEWGEQSRLEFGIDEDLHVSTAPDVVLHVGLRWSR